MVNLIPAAVTIIASIIAATWCMIQGSTINASITAEKGRSSVWGTALNYFGALLIFYGFLSGLMLLTDSVSVNVKWIIGIVSMLGLMLVVTAGKSRGDEDGIKFTLGRMNLWGVLTAFIIVSSLIFILPEGGEGMIIPESAWPLLMGALTMIGSGLAAAMCIMTAVKAGSEMLIKNPELSIWSLLFVALGEGLAIYGLIVAILLIG
ncbi:MAG: ATP synthase subunit C [Candidatus Bathyarchaeota archaeon]|nr:ATP synthase subunit C [Candidatus Bathyarchaeota archaeon]